MHAYARWLNHLPGSQWAERRARGSSPLNRMKLLAGDDLAEGFIPIKQLALGPLFAGSAPLSASFAKWGVPEVATRKALLGLLCLGNVAQRTHTRVGSFRPHSRANKAKKCDRDHS